jgi:nucleotide-binding universal stress UspA family protein
LVTLAAIGLAASRARLLAELDAAEIEFVDPGDQLVAAGAVDLPDPLAALERLADLDREARKLAGDRRAELERVEIGAGDGRPDCIDCAACCCCESWLPWSRSSVDWLRFSAA